VFGGFYFIYECELVYEVLVGYKSYSKKQRNCEMEKSGGQTVLVIWELAESRLQSLWEEDGGTEGGER
jgi:hypothetical protein